MSDLPNVLNWQGAVWLAGSNILSRFFGFLPSFFGALLILVIGLILAKWSKALIVKILGAVQLDKVLRKSGFDSFLNKADIRVKAETFIGEIARWLIIFIFFSAGINVLGLTTVSSVLNNLLSYIPNIVSATLVLTVGVILAGFVEKLIKGTLNQIEPKTSRFVSRIASYLVVVFAVLAAVNELGIAQSLINTLFIGIVATLSLGIGLALGLGSKDLVAEILKEYYLKTKKRK